MTGFPAKPSASAERCAQESLLLEMFRAAVGSALPQQCLPGRVPAPPLGRTVVVGAGKASAAMARTLEDCWPTPLSGVVVTRYGHAVACDAITILEAGHPVPDAASVEAGRRILDAVSGLTADDLVICLISGGGSALLSALPPGVSLEDERALSKALLNSGATIEEMNCVRKHVSLIKGGRLATAAAPARVVTLAISDVPGDDPATIASGPTVPDPTTREQALAVVDKYAVDLPAAVRAWLASPDSETPKPRDGTEPDYRMIATPQRALEAAADVARKAGYTPFVLGDAIEGEARDVGLDHAGIARQIVACGQPVRAPCVLLSGGETTVTVRGDGRGGRNVEFLLGLLAGLQDLPGVFALAADTDGIDGTEDNAGAIISPSSSARASAAGLSTEEHLARNDAYGFFVALGDLVITGATLTNVNDFRAILIDAAHPVQEQSTS